MRDLSILMYNFDIKNCFSMSKITIEKELLIVERLIQTDLIKDRSISDLYKHIFNSSGKKIRAKLCLLSSKPSNNNKLRYKLAAVIELLHTATLVHDDVVDNSPTRRGKKSINNIWTNSHGVLIGDYIYSKAFIYMVDIANMKILKELSKATNDISQGELIQLDSLKNTNVSLQRLKKISYFKTGRLFEASAKSGAILAGFTPSKINAISEYAKNLGILFQVKDDLLDYSIDNDIGKPLFKDLKEGKITYPFYYAHKNASSKNRKILEKYLGNEKINIQKAYNLISDLKGIKLTEKLAYHFYEKSIQSVKKINDKRIEIEMLELIDNAFYRAK